MAWGCGLGCITFDFPTCFPRRSAEIRWEGCFFFLGGGGGLGMGDGRGNNTEVRSGMTPSSPPRRGWSSPQSHEVTPPPQGSIVNQPPRRRFPDRVRLLVSRGRSQRRMTGHLLSPVPESRDRTSHPTPRGQQLCSHGIDHSLISCLLFQVVAFLLIHCSVIFPTAARPPGPIPRLADHSQASQARGSAQN